MQPFHPHSAKVHIHSGEKTNLETPLRGVVCTKVPSVASYISYFNDFAYIGPPHKTPINTTY